MRGLICRQFNILRRDKKSSFLSFKGVMPVKYTSGMNLGIYPKIFVKETRCWMSPSESIGMRCGQ
ncbi:hypothetical protein JHK86_054078 [Glycine max]|nr:hypothetical protein JHK86_054078 [Glycine max]